MKIYFLNVGHGDTTLIDFNGTFMLIDCKITGIDDDTFKFVTISSQILMMKKKNWTT